MIPFESFNSVCPSVMIRLRSSRSKLMESHELFRSSIFERYSSILFLMIYIFDLSLRRAQEYLEQILKGAIGKVIRVDGKIFLPIFRLVLAISGFRSSSPNPYSIISSPPDQVLAIQCFHPLYYVSITS